MKLRILSYNIHRAIGVDRRFRPQRIVDVLDHHDADIVLLQEVDHDVPRSKRMDLAMEIAEMAGYKHYAVGHNVKLPVGMYGNATLSRLPISYERNIDLTIPGKKARGCQHTCLEMPNQGGLHIFNLHLGLSAQERVKQTGMLFRSPEYTDLKTDTPCVIAGDFNDWRSLLQPIYTEILGFKCATNRKAGYLNPLLTYPAFSPSGGLDRIYYRGRLRVEQARRCRLRVSKVASDHLPVIADLRLV